MKTLGRKWGICVITIIVSALAACGGGGDGGGSGGGGQPTAAAVAITAANAPAVSAETVDAGNAGLAGALAFLTGVQVETDATPTVSVMNSLASAVRLSLKVRAPKALLGVVSTQTEPCPGGGTAVVTVDVASETRTSVGDTFDAALNNCVVEGSTANGRLSGRVVSVNAAETLIVADFTATNFTATAGTVGGRANGALRVTFDDTSSAISRVGITGDFTTERLRSGTVRATRTMSSSTLDSTRTAATGSVAVNFSFKASGTFPTLGTVSFDARTTQAFITPRGATRPTSGVAKVTGANGSSITITVISTGVRLDIDANGDGTAEATQSLTWAQLDAQL